MQDLGEALSVDKDDIRIHPTTQHIEIKVREHDGIMNEVFLN